jgi:DNA-binding response OmpR family regulator
MPGHGSAEDERKETAMRRIPVVDDDLHVGQAIGVWLKAHGFRVATADGGPAGLAAPDNATSDLMTFDVFMPHRTAQLE